MMWGLNSPINPMTTTLTLIATLLALLLVPILFIAWLTESDPERIRRWRRQGLSQQKIADRIGCSRAKVRRVLAAA